MDICRVTHAGDPEKGDPDTVAVILTTHETSDDPTPLQMISMARLQQLLAIETAARALAASLRGLPDA